MFPHPGSNVASYRSPWRLQYANSMAFLWLDVLDTIKCLNSVAYMYLFLFVFCFLVFILIQF